MSQSPRAELAGILFQEIETYLPEIDRSLTLVRESNSDTSVLNETHRLFHNIKGAASQVAFTGLSKAAALGETILSDLLERSRQPVVAELDFLNLVNSRIRSFCDLEEKSKEAENLLISDTIASFETLLSESAADTKITLPETIQSLLNEQSQPASQSSQYRSDEVSEIRTDTLTALRSILPLLKELADCSSTVDREDVVAHIIDPMSSAVSTFAQCSLTAGLVGQHHLLSKFLLILEKIQTVPSLYSEETPALLEDFLVYLDLVFSLPPDDSEAVIAKTGELFTGLNSLLESNIQLQKGVKTPFEAEVPLAIGDDLLGQSTADVTADSPVIEFDEGFEFTDSLVEQEQVLTEDDLNQEELDTTDSLADIPDELSAEKAIAFNSDEQEPAAVTTLSDDEIELHNIFKAECEEHLQVIYSELNFFETEIRDDQEMTEDLQEHLGSMRRAVHTMKGAAAMTGFSDLATCSHSLEDLLDWLHDESVDLTTADVSQIAEAVDTIDTLSQNLDKSNEAQGSIGVNNVQSYLLQRKDTALELTDATEIVEEEVPEKPETAASPVYEPVADMPVQIIDAAELAEKPNAEQTTLPADAGNVRVKLDDLDELVSIEGELVVTRGSVEKLLEKFTESLHEFNTIKDSLQRKSQELEVGFEAQSLLGFGSGTAAGELGGTEQHVSSLSEFDPIELDRYSQLNLIIRSLNEISIDVNAIYSQMTALSDDLQGQVAKQQLAMGVMQEKLMRIRMMPLSVISRMLFRTVRQTAKQLEKDVQLTITGDDVFMDRFVWSKIIDPLMHILRNCVDHGIEEANGRQDAGKPETGSISINASQRGRLVILNIEDDGRGIDTEILRSKLISQGLIAPDSAISDEQLLPYLFKPSVSTKDDVSEVSGRGVGLDVVMRNVQELRGNVKVANNTGSGVSFEISLPITLSVNRAVIISLGDAQYAIPLQDIAEVKKYYQGDIEPGETGQVTWQDTSIPTIDLRARLNLPKANAGKNQEDLLLLVVNTGEGHVGLEIDKIDEQREIVIKNLGSHLRYVRGINGVTVTGEGSIIPILNLRELALDVNEPTISTVSEPAATPKKAKELNVLIVDDSISVRYSISRLVENQSWKPFQAVDGLDAFEQLETVNPDVIILDIEMPRMNGYEFMSLLNNNESYKDTPVIMLTSRASGKHKSKAEDLGVKHYMTKPYEDDEFIELIQSLQRDS